MELIPLAEGWQLQCGGQNKGTILLTTNPFHSAHRNLILNLEDYDVALAAPLMDLLRSCSPEPLKFMCSSTDSERIRFVRSGGFRLVRQCYEREYPRHLCKASPAVRLTLEECQRGQHSWEDCAALLYRQYTEKHASISPLTCDFPKFGGVLPNTVWYNADNGEIRHFIFVEDNEIAYLGTADTDTFPLFLETVLARIFAAHETVCFEADSNDPAAMALQPFFQLWGNHSYNTYLLD